MSNILEVFTKPCLASNGIRAKAMASDRKNHVIETDSLIRKAIKKRMETADKKNETEFKTLRPSFLPLNSSLLLKSCPKAISVIFEMDIFEFMANRCETILVFLHFHKKENLKLPYH